MRSMPLRIFFNEIVQILNLKLEYFLSYEYLHANLASVSTCRHVYGALRVEVVTRASQVWGVCKK